MKRETISRRRRQLLIAGASVPAALAAAQWGAAGGALAAGLPASTGRAADTLIASGRMLDAAGKPLAGALVEVLDPGTDAEVRATTDADGRFMFTSAVPRAALDCRVSLPGRETVTRRLHFAHLHGIPADQVARLQRDEAGVWRTTFGLTLT